MSLFLGTSATQMKFSTNLLFWSKSHNFNLS